MCNQGKSPTQEIITRWSYREATIYDLCSVLHKIDRLAELAIIKQFCKQFLFVFVSFFLTCIFSQVNYSCKTINSYEEFFFLFITNATYSSIFIDLSSTIMNYRKIDNLDKNHLSLAQGYRYRAPGKIINCDVNLLTTASW